jgi:predicted house-cleaning noncanonical NTP pyrophosphatase (MazG superfamily)
MKKVYHKLIRDRIPEIIIKAGEAPKTRKLNKKDFLIELKKKVLEEAKELVKAQDKKEILNEIVDIKELIEWLAKGIKVSPSYIKTYQVQKNKTRGSFKKRLYLIETEK